MIYMKNVTAESFDSNLALKVAQVVLEQDPRLTSAVADDGDWFLSASITSLYVELKDVRY